MNIFKQSAIYLIAILLLNISCTVEDPEPAKDGLSSMLITSTFEPNENCPNGGVKVESGLDRNENEILDPEEIDQTQLICHGQNGTDGNDATADGLGKTYVTLTGDITDEAAAIILKENVGSLTQYVTITNTTQVTTLDLSVLQEVFNIQILGNEKLSSVNLDNLSKVYGTIQIYNNKRLHTISLPILSSVNGSAQFGTTSLSNSYVKTLNIPELIDFKSLFIGSSISSLQQAQYSSGFVGIYCNISSFDFSYLTDASNLSFTFYTPTLQSIDFSNLTHIQRLSFSLSNNLDFGQINLPKLQSGWINISEGTLTTLSLPEWSTGSLNINGCDQLTSISIPKYENGGSLILQNNDLLEEVNYPSLTSLTEYLAINTNTKLTNIQFDRLETVSFIEVKDNDELISMKFNKLSNLSSNSVYISLNIIDNKKLTDLSMPMLSSSGKEGRYIMSRNDLSTTSINNMLAAFLSFDPPLSSSTIDLSSQKTESGASGQGATDAATLRTNGNSVNVAVTAL